MAYLNERLVVDCPYMTAPDNLAAVFEARRLASGVVHFVVTLPARMFAERRSLIERQAIVTAHARWPADGASAFAVSWAPNVCSFLPRFAGTLAIEMLAGDDRSRLVLSGEHEAPLGPLEPTYAPSLAQRIAQTIAREFLRTIAERVEKVRAHDDAARAGLDALRHRQRATPSHAESIAGAAERGAIGLIPSLAACEAAVHS